MLSKSQLNLVKSLHAKKSRKEQGKFLAEGIKTITEFIHSDYVVDCIYHSIDMAPKFENFPQNIKLIPVTEQELKKISTLQSPQGSVALIKMPTKTVINQASLQKSLTFVLDGIQDPGNFGTILRTIDWFGFQQVICSKDCVDAYNSKVIQASMGSLARIQVVYTDLGPLFDQSNLPVFATMLHGTPIYNVHFPEAGFILLGNEGNGIRKDILRDSFFGITIPKFGGAESLNVALSAAIVCSEIRRPS